MLINWNFAKLMKRGREQYINNKTFQDFFKKNVNFYENEKILDVGCGIGTVPRLIYKIFHKKYQLYGIDLDANLIKWGQKHWGKPTNIHLSQGNVYSLQFSTNEFDIITSFGLLEWLTEPLKALDEMIRVNDERNRFITLVLEKSRYQKFPINESDQKIYHEYLEGIKKVGCPIENEGDYIEKLFLKRDIPLKRHEILLENKSIISTGLVDLWERSFNEENFKKTLEDSMSFYLQFLELVGWTKDKLLSFIEDELSLEHYVNFYKKHLGEEIIQRTPIILLESH